MSSIPVWNATMNVLNLIHYPIYSARRRAMGCRMLRASSPCFFWPSPSQYYDLWFVPTTYTKGPGFSSTS